MVKGKLTSYAYVEGQQEKMYLEHIKNLINNNAESKYNVVFKVKDCGGSTPEEIVDKAVRTATQAQRNTKEYTHIAIFDYDNRDTEFKNAIIKCKKEKIVASYSVLNFDLWLLIHKTKFMGKVGIVKGYHQKVREAYRLPKTADIKDEKTIAKILNKITLSDVVSAIKIAEEMEKINIESNNYMFKDINVYDQPNLEICKFVKYLLVKCELYK